MKTSNSFAVDPAWKPLLRDLGVRPADIFRRAGLPEDLLSRTHFRLSTQEYFGLWESMQEEMGDLSFPIRIAETITAESLQPPLFAAMCSPDLSVALKRISQYKRLIGPMRLGISEAGHTVKVRFQWLDASSTPPASLIATELAIIVRVARIATREQVRPLKVVAETPLASASRYRRFFGVGVEKGNENSLTFSELDARRPFLTSNASLWQAFEPQLRTRLCELDETASMRERTRGTLLEVLPAGDPSMEAVAGKLAVSTRTLQRRLREEGTTFQAVLCDTREALARHYLASSRLTSAEISFLLGYESPNSFYRAFKDWTGVTPEMLRARAV